MSAPWGPKDRPNFPNFGSAAAGCGKGCREKGDLGADTLCRWIDGANRFLCRKAFAQLLYWHRLGEGTADGAAA